MNTTTNNVRSSPLPMSRSNDSTGFNSSQSVSSESEHTESQQTFPTPQNPFDYIAASDLSVSSDRSSSRNQHQQHPVPDSPLRGSRGVPLFVASSSPAAKSMTPSSSPAAASISATPNNKKPDQSGVPTQAQGGAQQQPPPPTTMQPRVLPFDLPQRQNLPPPIQQQQQQQHYQLPANTTPPQQQQHQPPLAAMDDDDGNTEPSSQPSSHDHSDTSFYSKTALGRLLLKSKRRKQDGGDDEDDDDGMNEDGDGALISGTLQKYGRNGKWQSRWFETDGECLSYYKSSKRTKLLATLDLEKVGTIDISPDDPQGCSFKIEVLGRDYHLRAESRASCRDWVITLNRVKEARLHQGNVKLVTPQSNPVDLLDRDASRDMTPRVVVVSNRERTRAVDEEDRWDEMMNSADGQEPAAIGTIDPSKRRSAIQTAVLGRWSKRNSSISRLAAKLARWARSLQKFGCMDADAVQLDRHVHPPGHDDKLRSRKLSKDDLSGMFGNDDQSSPNPAHSHMGLSKPSRNVRAFSVASEDDPRMIA